jgi:hypothetical protein
MMMMMMMMMMMTMALINDNGQISLFYPCGAKCPQLPKVL